MLIRTGQRIQWTFMIGNQLHLGTQRGAFGMANLTSPWAIQRWFVLWISSAFKARKNLPCCSFHFTYPQHFCQKKLDSDRQHQRTCSRSLPSSASNLEGRRLLKSFTFIWSSILSIQLSIRRRARSSDFIALKQTSLSALLYYSILWPSR